MYRSLDKKRPRRCARLQDLCAAGARRSFSHKSSLPGWKLVFPPPSARLARPTSREQLRLGRRQALSKPKSGRNSGSIVVGARRRRSRVSCPTRAVWSRGWASATWLYYPPKLAIILVLHLRPAARVAFQFIQRLAAPLLPGHSCKVSPFTSKTHTLAGERGLSRELANLRRLNGGPGPAGRLN